MPVTEYNSGASYLANDVVYAGPCRIKSVLGYNNKGSTIFFCIFDASTAPANGTLVRYAMPVGANSGFAFDWDTGRDFDHGIAWAISTTFPTLTLDSAYVWVNVGYGPKTNS